MSQQSFAVRSQALLEDLLAQLESHDGLADVDMDLIDGILKLVCDNGTQIIINRQEPLEQIWVASPLGPAHFAYDPDAREWRDTRTGDELQVTLARALGGQLGTVIKL
jgi:CyaY protein